MKKALLSGILVISSFLAAASPALAWTTYPYVDIGYTNGSYAYSQSSNNCSYWCQNWNGYTPYSYFTSPNVMASYNSSSYAPSNYVPVIGTTYVGDGYVRGWTGQYAPATYNRSYNDSYSNYNSYSNNLSYLQPLTNTYQATYTSGTNYLYPSIYYVGPRGGNMYGTSGYYPYVSGTPYIGY